MTECRTALRECTHGDIPAGGKAFDNAMRTYAKADTVIVNCLGPRPPGSSTSPITGPPN